MRNLKRRHPEALYARNLKCGRYSDKQICRAGGYDWIGEWFNEVNKTAPSDRNYDREGWL